jgi:DNA processing protein
MQTDERDYFIALALTEGIGPKILARLHQSFGSYKDVLVNTRQLQSVRGVGRGLAERIGEIDIAAMRLDLRRFERQHIHVCLYEDPAYPNLLTLLEDKPNLLFMRGAFTAADAKAVAIVGTRQPSENSLKAAWLYSTAFAATGWTIVSGLAKGVDKMAHQGALDAGGRTLAVLGNGVLNIYPYEHMPLAEQIERQGALLSEYHPDSEPSRGTLVMRNRLISALARALIVIEAGETSGALHAARYAHAQGRPVFALGNSSGNQSLLGSFAKPLPAMPQDLIAMLEDTQP